jgi:hypothetical protein
MKVIRLNKDTIFLGYNEDFGMYSFITHRELSRSGRPTVEAYSQCKIVDSGNGDVYHCLDNGIIMRNWKQVSESRLKSMISERNFEAVDYYHSIYAGN